MNPIRNLFEKTIAFFDQMDDPRRVVELLRARALDQRQHPGGGRDLPQFVKQLYQRNELVQGELRLGRRRVDLGADHLPAAAADRQATITWSRPPRRKGSGRTSGRATSSRCRSTPATSAWWSARKAQKSGRRRRAGRRTLTRWLGEPRSGTVAADDSRRPAREAQRARNNPRCGRNSIEVKWRRWHMGIRISGIGGYVPTQVMTNHELAHDDRYVGRLDRRRRPESRSGESRRPTRRPATWAARRRSVASRTPASRPRSSISSSSPPRPPISRSRRPPAWSRTSSASPPATAPRST